ncbi:hypothetical protein LSH36_320g03023 [Paralvinella palmiformis]|uniref:Uncharacterized protein n=1 Tax=Paralvinella palmiformis TaxID=53620 RepID=A0AAD9JHX7_9ANNE|nr:hypothetical protein LSH36_320g03023 [Paralvinella palmiformis]
MAVYLPKHKYRPKIHQTFILDDEAMNTMRELSEHRARISSERSEKTITLSTKRKTMQILRSSSRLSYRSLNSSICSSESAASSSTGAPPSSCTCDGGAGRKGCSCSTVSPWYVPDVQRLNPASSSAGRSDSKSEKPASSSRAKEAGPASSSSSSSSGIPNVQVSPPSPAIRGLKSSRKGPRPPNLLNLTTKGSSSTLPRSRSSPSDVAKNRWSSSLPRNLTSSLPSSPTSPSRSVFNNVITYLFGCGGKKACKMDLYPDLDQDLTFRAVTIVSRRDQPLDDGPDGCILTDVISDGYAHCPTGSELSALLFLAQLSVAQQKNVSRDLLLRFCARCFGATQTRIK